MANKTFDAIIIGAGIIGVSSAYQVAPRGLRVGILEKGPHVAAGSTGQSSAVVRQRYANTEVVQLTHSSLQMFQDWWERLELKENHDAQPHPPEPHKHPDGSSPVKTRCNIAACRTPTQIHARRSHRLDIAEYFASAGQHYARCLRVSKGVDQLGHNGVEVTDQHIGRCLDDRGLRIFVNGHHDVAVGDAFQGWAAPEMPTAK